MKWRIGDWVACSETDTVRNGSIEHKLERRAMEALSVLAERAGEVVKKDELIELVWGRLAVSDHSVAMVISQLRRAFRDDARAPSYIQTITKRGYRLIAPCEKVATPDAVRSFDRQTESARFAFPGNMGIVIASTGVAIAGLGALSAMLLL
jgi:DNA-binding winged helix-turn-helix (wHTH) protein